MEDFMKRIILVFCLLISSSYALDNFENNKFKRGKVVRLDSIEEYLEKLSESYNDLVNKQVKELQKKVDENSKKLSGKKKDNSEIEKLRQEMTKMKEDLEKKHKEDIDKIKADVKSELAQFKKDTDIKIEAINESMNKQFLILEKKFNGFSRPLLR